MLKNQPTMGVTWAWSLRWEDPLEKGMGTHSSILAWKIPMDRGLQSMGSQRIGHDWAAKPEKAMATHSSSLAWKLPRMEEPGRLQSMGSRRVGHDWATSLSLFTFMHRQGNGSPLQCSCLENPRDGRTWWAAVYGVAQSQTRLKRLSSRTAKHSTAWDIIQHT